MRAAGLATALLATAVLTLAGCEGKEDRDPDRRKSGRLDSDNSNRDCNQRTDALNPKNGRVSGTFLPDLVQTRERTVLSEHRACPSLTARAILGSAVASHLTP